MDATVGWYGFGFIIFSVFDLVFFPTYYKSGYKAGKAFLLAMIPVALLMACTEGIIYVPHLSWLDSSDPESLLRQLPVLGAGILIYVVSVFSAYHIAVKRYENVNLIGKLEPPGSQSWGVRFICYASFNFLLLLRSR